MEIKMAREDFLEYCGLKKDKKFSGSFSGIDGGDINAEYWFMGMEWSDINDIKDYYSYVYDKWLKIEEIPDHIDIKINPNKWKLENKLDILYHKLMPEFARGKTIFEKNSNSLKLNLLPLPFLNNDAKTAWNETRLEKTTGFTSFEEYKGKKKNSYENSILPARQKLFQNLLQKGKKPKTIFCFGKGYEDEFVWALTGNKKLKAREDAPQLDQKTVSGYNTKIEIYDINTSDIKRILICPFPYLYPYKKENEFTDNDWKTICDLAKK